MPGTFAAIGGVNFVRPANTTSTSVYQCTGTPGILPPTERIQGYTYPGINGQALKKLGAGSSSGKITGFIDAATTTDLASAKTALDALAKAQTSGNITFYDSAITVSNAIVREISYGNFWGYGGRSCLDFELGWESTG